MAKIAIMKTANVGTLRNNLSKYLDLVRKGETIEIFDRKTPIARLTPIEPSMKPAKGSLSPWMQTADPGRPRQATDKPLDRTSSTTCPEARTLGSSRPLLEERRAGR